MNPILDLGAQALSGHFPKPDESEIARAPLVLGMCSECKLVQLLHSISGDVLYHERYGYRSGINQTMRDHLAGIAAVAEGLVELTNEDIVLDIASNDGTLLHSYKTKGIRLVGVDPSIRQFGHYYRDDIVKVPSFFDASVFRSVFSNEKARVITSIAVFYDLENPHTFVEDVKEILAPDGIWILEQSDLRQMMAANSFDTVCHEHLEYYSFSVLTSLIESHGLRVFNIEMNASNGGSSRLFVCQKGGPFDTNETAIDNVFALEADARLGYLETFDNFRNALEAQRSICLEFIDREKRLGKVFHIYGASTKGNVLLQWYGLGRAQIDAAADRNSQKWGCLTPATGIPILSEEESRAMSPDYYLVLPWHFRDEFESREKAFIESGGRFVFPLPVFEIFPNE